MEKIHKEALRMCLINLCKGMNEIDVITTRLMQDDVINSAENQIVHMQGTAYERNTMLLDLLQTKSYEAFDSLVLALRETNQHHLAADLEKYLSERKMYPQRSMKTTLTNLFQPIKNLFTLVSSPLPRSRSVNDIDNSNSDCSLVQSEKPLPPSYNASSLNENSIFSKFTRTFIPVSEKSYMSWPGFCGQSLFCVALDTMAVVIYNIDKRCFLIFDFTNGQQISTFFLEPYQLQQGTWHGIRTLCDKSISVHENTRRHIIALIFDDNAKQYSLSNIKIEIEIGRTILVDTCCLVIEAKENAIAFLTEDENAQMYCIIYWHNRSSTESKTIFHIAKIVVDEYGKIQPQILIENRSIVDLWCRPFIAGGLISFHPLQGDCNIISQVPIGAKERSKIISVSSNTEGKLPPVGIWSSASVYLGQVFYYILTQETNSGEVWAFDWKLLRWVKYFELHEHVVQGEAGVSNIGHLFLHENCANNSCNEMSHLYNFSFILSGYKIFPTLKQLSVIFTHSKIQIIHGPKRAGKTTAMMLKALQSIAEDIDVMIFVSNSNLKQEYASNIKICNTSFDFNRIRIFEKLFPRIEDIPNDSTIFIDRLESLTYETKSWLQQRAGKTIIVLDADIKSGLDQPRFDFSWHRIPPLTTHDNFESDSAECATDKKSVELKETKGLKFQELSMAMMDEFYPDWWNLSRESETVCIPPCLDVDKNRYLGPTDCGASNFDSKSFSRKERQSAGQSAEDVFLESFQRSKVGGILVFGFDTMEFAKVRMMQSLFKKRGISQIECDFIFIHPSLGIFVIEMKATKQRLEERSLIYQKAIQNVKKTIKQIKLLFELLTGQKFDLPIFGAVCFPFAKIGKFASKSNVELIDNWHDDPLKLRKFFIDKMSVEPIENLDEESLVCLKKFSCALAGYRSLEFISPLYNVLAIHKMIANQPFIMSQSSGVQVESFNSDPINHTVFLTSEQLAIIECQHQLQIIYGLPGTGKTLIILIKALEAAKLQKPGKVHLNNDKLLRFPTIGYTLSDIDPEDDLFIDEASLELEIVTLLKQRQHATGKTIMVITGNLRPLQIIDVQEFLEHFNLTSYRHYKLETVIRNSISIVNTWKQEFPPNINLHMGHNINGPFVRREKLETAEFVLNSLGKLISQMLHKAVPSNICIITENIRNCEQIKSYLVSKNIFCGTLEEQMNNTNLLGVAKYSDTLSFEWPIIVVVSLDCIDLHEAFFLVATSRAIASLLIIERDYMAIQQKFDENLKSKAEINKPNKTKWSKLMNYFSPSIIDVFVNDMNIFDVHLAYIRHNYVPKEMRLIKQFSTCTDLFDCLFLISNNKILCHMLISDSIVCCPLKTYQKRSELEVKRIPKFMKFILADLSEEYKLRRGKIIEELVLKLLIANSDKNTSNFGRNYEKKMSNMVNNKAGWMAVKSIISILLLAYL